MAKAFLMAYQQAMLDITEMPAHHSATIIHDFLPDIDKDVLLRTLDDYKKMDTWNYSFSTRFLPRSFAR